MVNFEADLCDLAQQVSKLCKKVEGRDQNNIGLRFEIVATAKELINTLLTPEEHALQKSANGMEITAIRAVMKLGVLEKLPSSGTKNLQELSAETGAHPSLLERFLRLLVATRFIHQAGKREFGHTRFSQAYLGLPGDWFAGIMHDVVLKSMVHYPEYLDAHPDALIKEPASVTHNPYTWRYGREGENTWRLMGTFPEQLSRFQKGLAMMSFLNPITGYYPFDDLASADGVPLIVDVGGGAGQCLAEILRVHPQLKAAETILQDRPEVLALAEKNQQLPREVRRMPHDFFTPQPVQHARAYYLRQIIHDYSNEVAVSILKNIVPALASDSKVLLAELVVPEKVDEGSLPTAIIDMFVFHVGGKERTSEEFSSLLESAGLKLTRIWHAPGCTQAIIEAGLQ